MCTLSKWNFGIAGLRQPLYRLTNGKLISLRSSSAIEMSRSARVMPSPLNKVAYSDMSRFANSSSNDVSWYDTVLELQAGTCEFNL